MRRKSKSIVAWAGFQGGKIATWAVDDGFGGFTGKPNIEMPALFKRKREAMARFEDVRKVKITENPTRDQ